MRNSLFYSGVFMVGVALLYEGQLYRWRGEEDLVLNIAAQWNREIREPKKGPERIMVGVNANLDMIVSAVDFLEALNLRSTVPQDHAMLNSVFELEQLVAFSMQHCAGVERTFTDLQLFHNLTSIATTLSHVYYIGGNAALIADKIKSTHPSIEVMLVGPIGPRLEALLPSSILTQSSYPDGSGQDEIHMILEYAADAQWGQIKSTCANRIIFSHDVSNSKMVALEDIDGAVHHFLPDLVILSGAHLLGGQPHRVWLQRLNDISRVLKTSLNGVPVHWELATIGNMKFFGKLAEYLFPKVNSLGLNEQELLSVAKASNAPFDFATIPQKPDIEWASDLLHWLMLTYSSLNGLSVLSRVHFHSLSFHIIATVEGGPWLNSKEAVMAGARVAGLQACDTDTFNNTSFKLKIPELFHVTKTDEKLSEVVMSSRAGWNEWTRDGINFYASPVLVCNSPKKTVGLGDAISSLGLIYSEYHSTI